MTANYSVLEAKNRATLLRKLRAWFRQHRRDLPWRATNDPYRIWVSEIMLQQTQVATVIDYYHRFLTRFPTIAELAKAEISEVLQYWEGLGYYRRARQLHAAAQQVMTQHRGRFPEDFSEVLALPGIGRYTAGAICSFAYEQSLPILEANTQRLYCRLMCLRDDPKTTANQKAMWQFAEALVPEKEPGEINQALMELGSLVCTPANPKCDICPLLQLCPTAKAGLQADVPLPAKPKVFEHVHEIAWIVWHRNEVLLRECLPGERWEGLWDFPRFALDPDIRNWESQCEEMLRERFGLQVRGYNRRLQIKHGVTKYKITLDCFDTQLESGSDAVRGKHRWLQVDQLHLVPLHSTARRIADHLVRHPLQRSLWEE